MQKVEECSKEEIQEELQKLQAQYEEYRAKGLQLNMARGKPSAKQLDVSMPMLERAIEYLAEDGTDIRNYGILDGLPECKRLFAELLDIPAEQILIGGK